MTFSDLVHALPEQDLWHYIASSNKPVVMYGMGNGADKIISVLDRYNVDIADFFASDGFVRGQCFHEKKVLSFDEIKSKYDDFIILVSFGSEREDVIEKILRLDSEYELYLPDVPVAGDEIFDRSFFDKNIDAAQEAYELLDDELSRELYIDMILYKLTGKLEYLLRNTTSDVELYTSLFDFRKWERTVDLGAYNGDSVRFISTIAKNVGEIIAFEPDRKNYAKLTRSVSDLGINVEAYNACAWSAKTTLEFDKGGNRNSSVSGIGHAASVGDTSRIAVDAERVDDIVCDRRVDFIKYDVEGSEAEALKGSRETLLRSAPDVLLSGYHRSEDLFALVQMIHEYLPEHRIYMRRKRCLPAWEISICATSDANKSEDE